MKKLMIGLVAAVLVGVSSAAQAGNARIVTLSAGAGQRNFALWQTNQGSYEFRLVFESGSGIRSPEPQREDHADLYVCLDTTKPTVSVYDRLLANGRTSKVYYFDQSSSSLEVPNLLKNQPAAIFPR